MKTIIDPGRWLASKKKFFSLEMNGYQTIPYNSYISTLSLIDRCGKVIDLGCGNGMLLRFLIDCSCHSLIPFGIDKNMKAIEMAQKEVFPELKNNFKSQYLENCDFYGKQYDIIIDNIVYPGCGKEIIKYTRSLCKGGKFILRAHYDHFEKEKGLIKELFSLQNKGFKMSLGGGLIFVIFENM